MQNMHRGLPHICHFHKIASRQKRVLINIEFFWFSEGLFGILDGGMVFVGWCIWYLRWYMGW